MNPDNSYRDNKTKNSEKNDTVDQSDLKMQKDKQNQQNFEQLKIQYTELKAKTEQILVQVAQWQNNKEILLEDEKKRYKMELLSHKKQIAEICEFLELLKTTVEDKNQILLDSKIKNLGTVHQLQIISSSHFNSSEHEILSSSADASLPEIAIKKYVTNGYKYEGQTLVFAKVIL